jgi:hypothetical protein
MSTKMSTVLLLIRAQTETQQMTELWKSIEIIRDSYLYLLRQEKSKKTSPGRTNLVWKRKATENTNNTTPPPAVRPQQKEKEKLIDDESRMDMDGTQLPEAPRKKKSRTTRKKERRRARNALTLQPIHHPVVQPNPSAPSKQAGEKVSTKDSQVGSSAPNETFEEELKRLKENSKDLLRTELENKATFKIKGDFAAFTGGSHSETIAWFRIKPGDNVLEAAVKTRREIGGSVMWVSYLQADEELTAWKKKNGANQIFNTLTRKEIHKGQIT